MNTKATNYNGKNECHNLAFSTFGWFLGCRYLFNFGKLLLDFIYLTGNCNLLNKAHLLA